MEGVDDEEEAIWWTSVMKRVNGEQVKRSQTHSYMEKL